MPDGAGSHFHQNRGGVVDLPVGDVNSLAVVQNLSQLAGAVDNPRPLAHPACRHLALLSGLTHRVKARLSF
jgi:hypothetical protein